MNITIAIPELGTLRRVLQKPEQYLYGEPWANGMKAMAGRGGALAKSGAPIKTHKLQGSIRTAVQKSPFPQWAAIRLRARNKRYPYPRLLEFSPKHHHQNWLINAVKPLFSAAESYLGQIAKRIEENWVKGEF